LKILWKLHFFSSSSSFSSSSVSPAGFVWLVAFVFLYDWASLLRTTAFVSF
jgi:hypothetical protein